MEPPSPDLDAFEELTARRRSSMVCDRDREVPGRLLERVCSLVFTAPNHKKTTPWQVAVFTGAARATLGELLAADLVAEAPDIAPEKVDKTRVKYGRAPAIVVAGCRPDPDDPLRHREDLFAVAAGVENLLLGVASAGLGIMLLAVLGLFSDRTINAANAVKSLLAFAVNLAAASFLVFSGKVEWSLVAVMAPASLLGGAAGGRLVTVMPPSRLRPAIVTFGVIVAIIYLVR